MRPAFSLVAGSIAGFFVVAGGAGVAHAQTSVEGVTVSGSASVGGVRITVTSPQVRVRSTSGVQRFGVTVPRSTPSRLPSNFGGVRIPETTPSRIGRGGETRRLPPITQPTVRPPVVVSPGHGVVIDGRFRRGSFVIRRGFYGDRDFLGPGVVYGYEGRIISTGRYGYGYPTIRRGGFAAPVDPMLTTRPEPVEPQEPVSVLDAMLAGFVPSVGPMDLSGLDAEAEPDLARATAIAAILNGHTREGMLELAKIYQAKPELAARPLNLRGEAVQRAMRRAVSSAMSAANREENPLMWVAAAVVVQHVPGRGDVVERAVERGVRVGLFGRLADPGLWWGVGSG
ncbi:MAG: hypothetical protein EA423_05585 [Phycisphaerales bacterium]|nr:MAG: hypothetical protein EA423_05585 [Phycisphaerales bacterium]